MYELTATHVLTAFSKAGNLNAAIKAYLKLQNANSDPKSVRFAKTLREISNSGNKERLSNYVTAQFDEQRDALYSIAACAHSETIGAVNSQIAEKYCDEFNATYSLEGEKLEITKSKDFDRIAREALALVDQLLKQKDADNAAFLKAVAVNQLFERNVLAEIDKRGFLSK
jgi:hypothetical protein